MNSILCPSCGFENAAGIKFCGECGRPLGTEGANAPDPRSYTPRHLVEKILTARSALEGERKQVTVLFADVKESMDLAARLDPEEWHKVLDGFFRVLTDGVHRFEGTINQYTGDGIMALFGAPIAHEDHASRACYAALALKSELRRYGEEVKRTRGLSFAVRIGIHSGEVVVGKIGDDLRMDYTAQGETVGLAARLEQLADPGSVYVSERTAALVTGYFALRDLGTFTVKGLSAPARIFELEGAGRMRTRLEVAEARGFSRFVGREREIEILESALEQALGGNGQIVGIVADPGVGKSRLCLEFVARCRKRGLYVNEGHCPPHGKVVPYLPILELWRSYFGVGEKDSDEEARRKIAGTLLLLDESFRDSLPTVFEFLAVPDANDPPPRIDPEAKQRELLGFLRRLTQKLSEREPFVILIDDLHWVDRASDAFVAEFAEAIDGRRALFLVNFRPEYEAGWMRKSTYRQISLSPLSSAAVEEMLDDLLGTDSSLGALRERIRDRSGGNPFFLEEIALSLIESGVLAGTRGGYRLTRPLESVGIPDTVHAVLAARIDRLPERDKAVLQAASVVGKSVPEPILRRVANLPELELLASLGALRQAEFVYEEAVQPETVHAFKHPLTHEVAYKTQLVERRKQAHAAVARAIEELYREKLDERAALVAHHWEAAGELLAAARWHARAAEWIGVSDYAEAYTHWQRVRALLGPAAESPEALDLQVRSLLRLLMLGYRVAAFHEEATALFAEGKALLERRGDERSLALFTDLYAGIRQNAGAVREYLELASEATRLADRTDDLAVRAGVRVDLSWALSLTGRLAESVAVANEGLEIVGGDVKLGMDLFGFSSQFALTLLPVWALLQMGRLHEAEERLVVALRLAREHGPLESVSWSHSFHVFVAEATGEARRALVAAQAALEAAERAGSPQALAVAFLALGIAHTLSGEWKDAIEAGDHCLRIAREKGVWRDGETYMLATLARAHLGCGDVPRARAVAEEAAALARHQGTLVNLCAADVLRARALVARDGARAAGEVEAILAEAERLISETGAALYLPEVHLERAELARLSGDEVSRERELREAHRLFLEIGAPIRAAEVARELES